MSDVTIKSGGTRHGRSGGTRTVRRLTRVFPVGWEDAWWLDPQRLVLGRDPGDDGLRLPDDAASRVHAELAFSPSTEGFRLRDLNSRNGTFVDGRRIDDVVLSSGAVIRIGETLLVYTEQSVRASMPLPEPAPGGSLALALAHQLADLAAASTLPVVIQGPTGAGKELLARRIHERSGRQGEMVAVNCAAFGRDLVESELFGHARGAFSGAQGARAGLIVSADRGTLFLDEIAELPLEQQPKLLRALQEKRVRPVGSDREVTVDVRTICASHQDLATLEASGRFRSDLLARLSGVRIVLPPLRERREEILPLFLAYEGSGKPLHIEAAEMLLLHDWPHNVRDLQHAASQVRLFSGVAEAITPELLPEEIAEPTAAEPARGAEERPTKAKLVELLAAHGGNVAGVARALDKHRAQVYRWLTMYGIDPGSGREG